MFNWDEFKNEKVAIHCDTEEKAREFIKECHKRDIKWHSSSSENETRWKELKNDTCYCFSFFNDGHLGFSSKVFYEVKGCKIIKWESEKMMFKVGDKVRVIDNGKSYTTHSQADRWIGEGSDSKPYNLGVVPEEGIYGVVRNMNEYCNSTILVVESGEYSYLIKENGVELVEEPTEFTFQELIARNIPGTYVNKGCERIESIEIDEDGSLTIKADFSGLNELGLGLGVDETIKFKLQEPKKKYVLYGIEHQEDGKIYFFRSKEDKVIPDTSFVICNTSKGKSYGRAVQRIEKELTESEYKQYKECWRA